MSLARLPEAAAEVDAAVRTHGMRLRRGHESLELRAALEHRCEELDTLYNVVAHHCDAPLLEAQRAKLQACLFGQPQHFLSSAEELLREAWTIVTSGEALLSRAASTPPHEVHNKSLWRQLASSRYTCAEHIIALSRARSGAGPDAAIDAWIQCLESLKRRLDTALASGDCQVSWSGADGLPSGQRLASLTQAKGLQSGGHVFCFHLTPEEHQEFIRRLGSDDQVQRTQQATSGQQRASIIRSNNEVVDEWVQQCMDSLKTNITAKTPGGSPLEHKQQDGEHTFTFHLKEEQYQEFLRRGGRSDPVAAADAAAAVRSAGESDRRGIGKGVGQSSTGYPSNPPSPKKGSKGAGKGGKASRTPPRTAVPAPQSPQEPEPDFEATPLAGKRPAEIEPWEHPFDDDDETF